MLVATSLPSLSQVQALDTTYLQEADRYWTRTGNLWDQVFTKIHETMSTPRGAPWEGQAAAAAQDRAYIDLMKVRGATFQLHEAAGIARRGDEQLLACKQEVLGAVRDARAAGFEVGEDYAVTDRTRGGSAELRAERLAHAEGHAAFIRHRIAALIAIDQEITTQITAATKDIDNLTFHEALALDDTTVHHGKHSVVQPVDHHWKQEPTPTPEPGPTKGPSAADIRRVLEKLPAGSDPRIREVRSPDELERLWDCLGQHGAERPGAYGPDPSKGVWKDLPDGGGVGRRRIAKSTEDPAIDIKIPGENGNWKVHINPRGGVPDIPWPAEPAPPEATEPGRGPAETPPEAPEPVEAPPVRGGIAELPFGPGLTAHSPATGPHPVYGPEHHSLPLPLLGDEPDEVP
jgi:hypothetical protein